MLSSWNLWRRRPRVPLRRPRYRPQLEALEDRLLLSHSPLAPEFPVSSTPLAGQFSPPPSTAVASNDSGNFVVVSTLEDSGGLDIVAQRYNAAGVAQGGVIDVSGGPILAPSLSQSESVTVDVAMDGSGNFEVVYDAGQGSAGSAVFVHRYAADGTDLGSQQVSPAGDPNFAVSSSPSVAADCAGDFVIAYAAEPQFSEGFPDVYVQRYDANGSAQGGPLQVNDANTPLLQGPSVSSDEAGNFVVTWNAGAGESSEIVARRFSATGAALDAQPFVVSTNAGFGSTPDVSVAGDTGAFVITWNVNNFDYTQYSEVSTIFAQRFDASGQPAGASFVVNTATLDGTALPHVATDCTGDFAIGWSTGQGAFSVDVRFFAADGTPEGDQVKANATSQDRGPNDIASDGNGNVMVVWAGVPQGQTEQNVLARIFATSAQGMTDGCSCGRTKGGGGTGGTPTPPAPLVPPPAATPVVATLDQSPAQLIALLRSVPQQPPRVDPFVLLTLGNPTRPPDAFPVLPSLVGGELPQTRLSGDGAPQTVGEISGVVFQDLNGNGKQDEGERGLPGQLVFLDLNDNGVFDPSEPFMITDARGQYLFGGLPLNRYHVRQDLRQIRLRQTTPVNNAARVVNLSLAINSVSDQDFGTLLGPVAGLTAPQPPRDEPSPPEE